MSTTMSIMPTQQQSQQPSPHPLGSNHHLSRTLKEVAQNEIASDFQTAISSVSGQQQSSPIELVAASSSSKQQQVGTLSNSEIVSEFLTLLDKVGNCLYTYVVVTVCLKAGLEMNSWTILTHLAIWGNILSWFVFLVIYSRFWPTLPIAPDMVAIDRLLYGTPVFWFGLALVPITALMPDVILKVLKNGP